MDFAKKLICRACLCENQPLSHLSDIKNDTILLHKYITLTNIQVNDSNAQYSFLCLNCIEKLDNAYGFLLLCQRSEDFLTTSVKVPSEIDESGEESKDTKVSDSEVLQAIKDSNKSFTENVTCIKCGFTGSNARALSIHVSHLHPDIKEQWCVHCNDIYENFDEHVKIHKNSLTCRFCNCNFQNKGHLKEHLLTHLDCKPYTCAICGRGFTTQRHLHGHEQTHFEKDFKCLNCDRSFADKVSLEVHCRNHKSNGCELTQELDRHNYCSKCNKNVRSLTQHNQKTHSNRSEGFVDSKLCSECGKLFRTTAKLQIHKRVHTGEMPYECEYCGRRCSTRNHLRLHLRTHTGERPHVCHVCGKSFAQSSVLNTHLRIHMGRPEVCKICDKQFCRPAELRLHLRRHTGEKPYKCKECKRGFVQLSHLVQHEKIHSEERPFTCNYCDKSFKLSSILKSHVNIHFGIKPYKCTLCSYAARQSYPLQIHMKKHLLKDVKSEAV